MKIKNTPYTYLIGWSKLNKYYYGVRYKHDCHPKEFWIKYFTSSKHVHALIESEGNPDIIEVRKTFDDVDKAILWEKRVLTKLKIFNSDKWINKNIAGAIKPQRGSINPMFGKNRKGEKHKGGNNISKSLKDFYLTAEGLNKRKLMSKKFAGKNNPMYGKRHTADFIENKKKQMTGILNPMYGKNHTEETKQKLRKTFLVNDSVIVFNAKEWCQANNLYYKNFLRAASLNKKYKGLKISYYNK